MSNSIQSVSDSLSGQKLKLPSGSTAVIKKRKKGLTKKPLLYMWDLTRACYVSSLKPVSDNSFMFDIRTGEDSELYYLIWNNGITLKKADEM